MKAAIIQTAVQGQAGLINKQRRRTSIQAEQPKNTVATKGNQMRNKYRQMQSQVQEEMDSQPQNMEHHMFKEMKPKKEKYQDQQEEVSFQDPRLLTRENELKRMQQDFKFKTHQEFLHSISTFIDVEKDLKLYKIDRSLSNDKMSVIGIQILSPQLQEKYGNKKYIIRCYQNQEKFFEYALSDMPIQFDVLHTTMAWMMNDTPGKIFAINVGGQYPNGKTIGDSSKSLMLEPISFTPQFFRKSPADPIKLPMPQQNQIKSFKIGINAIPNTLKIMIITTGEIYRIMFSTDSQINNQYIDKSRIISKDDLNFTEYELNKPEKSRLAKNNNNGSEEPSPRKAEGERRLKFFDFNINDDFMVQKGDDIIYETLLCQDNSGTVHVLKGQAYGNKFKSYASLKIREKVGGEEDSNRKNRYTFELKDAVLVQTHKIILFLQVNCFKNPDQESCEAPTREEIQQVKADLVTYKLQVWEITENKTLQKTLTFDIPETSYNDVILNWRQQVIIDKLNNFFYIPDYRTQELSRINRLKIQNSDSGAIDTYDLQLTHILDIVGHHLDQGEKLQDKYFISGLLYQDFLVYDSYLYVVHGKFITILDIHSFRETKAQTHLSFEDQLKIANEEFTQQFSEHGINYANQLFSEDVESIVQINKESLDLKERYQVLVIFKNGVMLEVKEHPSIEESDEEELKIHKINIRVPNMSKRHKLSFYLNGNDLMLRGQLIKTIKLKSNKNIPFFLIKKPDESFRLCTLEIQSQILKEYQIPDLCEYSNIQIMESKDNIYEQILLTNSLSAEHSKSFNQDDQQIKHVLLYNEKIEINENKNSVKVIKEDVLSNGERTFNQALDIVIQDEFAYLVYPRQVQVYEFSTNTITQKVDLIENIQQLAIFKNKYFYWRQYHKNDFYLPTHSHIFFDSQEDLSTLRQKSSKYDFSVYQGIYPHLPQLYYDDVGEQMACFTSYNQITIFPMLHENSIKLKYSGKQTNDTQVIASQMFGNLLYTLHNDNTIRQWNIKNGKFIQSIALNSSGENQSGFSPTKRSLNFQNFRCNYSLQNYSLVQQKINQKQFLIRYYQEGHDYKPQSTSQVKSRKNFMAQASVGLINTKMDHQIIKEQLFSKEPIEEEKEENEEEHLENQEDDGSMFDQSVEDFNESTPRASMRVKQKEVNEQLISVNFNLHSYDSSKVGITLYKIIEIEEIIESSSQCGPAQNTSNMSLNNHTQSEFTKSRNQKVEDQINRIRIKEVMSFEGPCMKFSTNFGLYAAEDLSIFAFNFRDQLNKIQIYYYKEKQLPHMSSGGTSKHLSMNVKRRIELQFYCQAPENIWLSTHSNDFKYFLWNKNEQLEATPFDIKVAKREDEVKKETDKLQAINQKLKDMNQYIQESPPSFIAKDKIAFISPDQVIMVYSVFDSEDIPVKFSSFRPHSSATKELFNFAQSKFPGQDGPILMDCIFMQENTLIGENVMLMGINQHPDHQQYSYETVAPNYFNKFLQQQAWNEFDQDDSFELKYIQNRYKIKIELSPKMYNGYIFRVKDYLSPENFGTELHIVNTYSYLQWRALSLFQRQKLLVEDIPKTQLQDYCYCQLPNGKTILHLLKKNLNSIRQLYACVYDKNIDKEAFYIPLFEDEKNRNALKSVLRKKQPGKNDDQKSIDNFESIKTSVVLEILLQIGEYPFHLFNIRISSIIKDLIDIDIFKFAYYMERRSKAPSILTQLYIAKIPNDVINVMTTQEIWFMPEKSIRTSIERKSEELKQVEIKVVDVRHIHLSKNLESNRYNINLIYEKLAKTDSLEIFSFNSVKALIEIKWKYIKYRIIIFLLIPYVCFMICFTLYTCYDLEHYASTIKEDRLKESSALRVLLWILTAYFGISEIRQFLTQRWQYFLNAWNLMDLALIILVTIGEAIYGRYNVSDASLTDESYEQLNQAVRTIYAIAAIVMWIRFLYFFRIFRTTGYYIRMVLEVIKDIRYFIFIFVLTIIAFAHAWFVYLKNGGDDGGSFKSVWNALGYTYRLSLGDFDVDKYGSYHIEISWIFFILATFLLQIVLINLLISIVADTFTRIKGNYNIIMYKDMLHMIIENRFLAFGPLPPYLRNKHLLMAIPITESSEQTQINGQLDEIANMLREQSIQKKLGKKGASTLQRIEEKETQIMERLDKLEERQLLLLDQLSTFLKSK